MSLINTKVKTRMFKFAVLTISTKGAAGERVDESGPLAERMLARLGSVAEVSIVPDDRGAIESALIRLADELRCDAVFTSGGTGFAPSDVTPEATLAVCERLAPGIPEALRAAGLQKTNRAMLSRGAAGIRGRTLIVNLPGSPAAVRENLGVLLPCLEHALTTLRGETMDCARKDRC